MCDLATRSGIVDQHRVVLRSFLSSLKRFQEATESCQTAFKESTNQSSLSKAILPRSDNIEASLAALDDTHRTVEEKMKEWGTSEKRRLRPVLDRSGRQPRHLPQCVKYNKCFSQRAVCKSGHSSIYNASCLLQLYQSCRSKPLDDISNLSLLTAQSHASLVRMSVTSECD